jgi:hypothetical protein
MKSTSLWKFTPVLCALLAAGAWAGPALASGQVYYVAVGGNNSGPGSQGQPWGSIGYAAGKAVAGDTVYVRGGTYHESIDVNRSGSATDGPIVFAGYPGETVVVSGTGLPAPGGTMRGLWNLNNVSYVTVQGFEVSNYGASSSADTPVGIYVNGGGTQLQILNNHVHDIANTVEACPKGNAFGIEVYANDPAHSINHLTISGNEVDHLRLGCSESLSLTGNVEQWTISNNSVHDNDNIGIAALGFEAMDTAGGGSFQSQARDGMIVGNKVYNLTSQGNPAYKTKGYSADGIYVEGGARVVVERNLVQKADIGIELACETQGKLTSDVIARDNLVMYSQVAGISVGGADTSNGGTQNATIVNNTLFRNDTVGTGSGEFQIQFHVAGTVFENNLVYANGNGLLVNYAPSADANPGYPNPGSIDHNLYFADGGAGNANWVWQASPYTSIAAYSAASSGDYATLLSDPQLLSVDTPDLHVGAASPARGAGLGLPISTVGALDYAGAPRFSAAGTIDIGAYQQP